MPSLREKYLQFLIATAKKPGRGNQIWTWQRAQELAAHPILTEMRGIDEDLKKAMKNETQNLVS